MMAYWFWLIGCTVCVLISCGLIVADWIRRYIDSRIERMPKPGYLGPWPPQAGQVLDSRYDYRHLPWHESVEPLRSQGFLIPDVPHQLPRWDEGNL